MADINVERNSPSAIWWTIGLIALALFIWLLFAWGTEPTATRLPNRSTPIAAVSGHLVLGATTELVQSAFDATA